MKKPGFLQKVAMLLFVSGFAMSLHAQEAVTSAGGEAGTASGSVSFSVGQVQYMTYESDSGVVTEGVQQPYEIYEIISVPGLSGPEMAVYPNPAINYVFIDIPEFADEKIAYVFQDVKGKTLFQNSVYDLRTEIDLTSYTAGVYLLQITINGQHFKTFKIIKNQ